MTDRRVVKILSLMVVVLVAAVVFFGVVALQSNEHSVQLLHKVNARIKVAKYDETVAIDIAKGLFVLGGDISEAVVGTRNELCANDEALARDLDRVLGGGALLKQVTHQCAIPFQAPTIEINGQGKVSNKTGLPPGV